MLKKLILPLAAVAVLGSGAAYAEATDKAPGKRAPMSAEEVKERAAQKFDELDTDKDGVISIEELDKHHEAQKARHEEERAKRAEDMKKKRLEKIDPDGDGKITREEFLKNAGERHERMQEHREKRGKGKPPVNDAAPKAE